MKTLALILTTLLINCISCADALYVFTFSKKKPSEWNVADNPGGWTYIEWEHAILDVINMINSYLRFAVWFVCFLFMVINGYKLITANGDEKKSSSAMTGLIWSVVWIVICLLSYIIVNIAVKLFA